MLPTHNPPIISSKEMWKSNETLEITLKLGSEFLLTLMFRKLKEIK